MLGVMEGGIGTGSYSVSSGFLFTCWLSCSPALIRRSYATVRRTHILLRSSTEISEWEKQQRHVSDKNIDKTSKSLLKVYSRVYNIYAGYLLLMLLL